VDKNVAAYLTTIKKVLGMVC